MAKEKQSKISNEKNNFFFGSQATFWIVALSIFFLAFVQLITFEGQKTLSFQYLLVIIGLIIILILSFFTEEFNKKKKFQPLTILFLFLVIGLIFIIIENTQDLSSEVTKAIQQQPFWNSVTILVSAILIFLLVDFLNKKINKKIIFSIIYIVSILCLYLFLGETIISLFLGALEINIILSLLIVGSLTGLFLYFLKTSILFIAEMIKIIKFLVRRLRKK